MDNSIISFFFFYLFSSHLLWIEEKWKCPLSHEICCTIPQTNNGEVAALNNYNLSQISRAALAAENASHMVSEKYNQRYQWTEP